MTELRIVTPEEARTIVEDVPWSIYEERYVDLAHTVATEYKRRDDYTRAAVVRALRDEAARIEHGSNLQTMWTVRNALVFRADAIENGADYA